ncbi:MAG: 3,4-dihydroxy-2-butanone-4-phosphate synthase [Rhodospirillaceae bacterium]|nr:MAG: 3,4-dihydroxy-2-butanone-4-phosphate synthase [Rhodospirillaceae bacterium]
MFVLVDDKDRENEGDLVIPAEKVTPETVNFMAKYGRGLICLALSSKRIEDLNLPLMSTQNQSRHQTAFTVSIEAREGVTTGISAADRARTIAVAIDPDQGSEATVSPGHVFPLAAEAGGVLVRAGHTEAAVDIARLAGLNPSGVICEIMNDDGTMARLPDLIAFAKTHGLKIGTIADLIAYRRRNEVLIERTAETEIISRHGGKFRMVVYRNKITGAEHVALVKGDPAQPGAVPVRMHALNVFTDILGEDSEGRGGEFQSALRLIGRQDRGVAVLIREAMPSNLSARVKARQQKTPAEEGGVKISSELRDYGIGAQILLDLGVRDMILLSNRLHTIIGLEGYGLRLVGQEPIPSDDSDDTV